MAIGKLTAYARKAEKTPWGDHTYVKSDQGHAWGCSGGATGGAPIANCTGNVKYADCLGQSDGMAGVIWGVTGMCHQMANRILLACVDQSQAQLVNAAVAFRNGTEIFFGEYGLDLESLDFCSPELRPWPEYLACAARRDVR